MRILFVVDGRSPIALNWINYFTQKGHTVHVASTFVCPPIGDLASLDFIPVAFSGARVQGGYAAAGAIQSRLWGAGLVGLRTAVRQWFGILTLSRASDRLVKVIDRIQPEIIHAMRIPFEGMLSAFALERIRRLESSPVPFVLSIWGNDFTLHARSNFMMAASTRKALRLADGLHTDCLRDQHLAHRWGFSELKQAVVFPGNGGIDLNQFHHGERSKGPLVINPRGVRAYVRNDTFFQAIPLVLERFPQAHFVCTGMAGEPQAVGWIKKLGISNAVELLPVQTRLEIAELFRRAQVTVSPTTHDGTPNTLLEAMACGCFPIAGDIESLREWISPGLNGLLFDPANPHALADALVLALSQPELRHKAAKHNQELIAKRADYLQVMPKVESFYRMMIGR